MNNNQGRKRVRRAQKKSQISRILLMICMMALVAVISIGGTIAWLTDSTEEVVNTFTDSDIEITLTETTGEEYKMVPGATISKDPYVVLKANSEKSWIFVKIDETANFDDFMTYEVCTEETCDTQYCTHGWTKLESASGEKTEVYYRERNATTDGQDSEWMYILKGNKVEVKPGVTKEMMNALTTETYPKLTFTAYAIQSENLTTTSMDEIWKMAQTNGSIPANP